MYSLLMFMLCLCLLSLSVFFDEKFKKMVATQEYFLPGHNFLTGMPEVSLPEIKLIHLN